MRRGRKATGSRQHGDRLGYRKGGIQCPDASSSCCSRHVSSQRRPSAQADVGATCESSIGGAGEWPDLAATAKRQNYVILHAWEIERLRALKHANPRCAVLLYKNLSSINAFCAQQRLPVHGRRHGRGRPRAPRVVPEEHLRRALPLQRLRLAVGGRHRQPRLPAALGRQRRRRARGPRPGTASSSTTPTRRSATTTAVADVAKYPSDAAYQAATRSALAVIGPQLRATGKLVVRQHRLLGRLPRRRLGLAAVRRRRHGRDVHEVVRPGRRQLPRHDRLGEPARRDQGAERRGKLFLGVTQSACTDRAAARYGWATCSSAPRAGPRSRWAADYTSENWFPEYDYALGDPRGASARR